MNRLPHFAVFICSVALAVSPAEAQIRSQPDTGDGSRWRLSDYGRHDSASFRKHQPARQVIRRENIDYGLLEAAVFHASNEQRVLHGVIAFEYSEPLRRAARIHSQDMAVFGFFAHNNPHDPSRRTPWKRMASQGVSGGHKAENIAMTSIGHHTCLSAADAIIAMWMKSPGHRRNLLNPRLRHLGCGVHSNSTPHFQLLATQNFSSVAN